MASVHQGSEQGVVAVEQIVDLLPLTCWRFIQQSRQFISTRANSLEEPFAITGRDPLGSLEGMLAVSDNFSIDLSRRHAEEGGRDRAIDQGAAAVGIGRVISLFEDEVVGGPPRIMDVRQPAFSALSVTE